MFPYFPCQNRCKSRMFRPQSQQLCFARRRKAWGPLRRWIPVRPWRSPGSWGRRRFEDLDGGNGPSVGLHCDDISPVTLQLHISWIISCYDIKPGIYLHCCTLCSKIIYHEMSQKHNPLAQHQPQHSFFSGVNMGRWFNHSRSWGTVLVELSVMDSFISVPSFYPISTWRFSPVCHIAPGCPSIRLLSITILPGEINWNHHFC